MTLPEIISEARELLARITVAPWSARPIGSWDQVPCISADKEKPDDLGLLLFIGRHNDKNISPTFAQQVDAEFIAFARNHMEEILDELERRGKALAAIESAFLWNNICLLCQKHNGHTEACFVAIGFKKAQSILSGESVDS